MLAAVRRDSNKPAFKPPNEDSEEKNSAGPEYHDRQAILFKMSEPYRMKNALPWGR